MCIYVYFFQIFTLRFAYFVVADVSYLSPTLSPPTLTGRIHLSGEVAAILQKTGKYIITERGAVEIKGKGLMTTFWLDKAHESNTNSNELAIAKLEVMVQEILQNGEQEDMLLDYEGQEGGEHGHHDDNQEETGV